jgi:hypothetical protein
MVVELHPGGAGRTDTSGPALLVPVPACAAGHGLSLPCLSWRSRDTAVAIALSRPWSAVDVAVCQLAAYHSSIALCRVTGQTQALMVGRVPLLPTLGHGHDVVDALGWCLSALPYTLAMLWVEPVVTSHAAQGKACTPLDAVLAPGIVVASLLGCASGPVCLCGMGGTAASGAGYLGTLGYDTGASRGSRHQCCWCLCGSATHICPSPWMMGSMSVSLACSW